MSVCVSGADFGKNIGPNTSAAAALDTVYRQIRDTGSSLGSSAPLYSFAEMNRLMGFDEVWRFDKEHAET